MSGFFASISPSSDPELLPRIAASLTFRGPDATHITTQSQAAFVFTFLRTGPAPQSPSQPVTLDNRLYLLGDVRLDARSDLFRKLQQHAAPIPPGVTDEQLILLAFQQFGEDAFPQLLGDFSFILWDSTSRVLLGVRDLLGLKPFFYAQTPQQFFASNTIDTLRCLPDVSSTLDPLFIADFLLQESSSDPEGTAFRDIHRLPPGHLLRLENSKLQIRRYTFLPIEDPLSFRRPHECTEHFRSLLDDAIRDRLPQNPVAIFMSGGLDSTSIAALAVSHAKKNHAPLDLRAYTVDASPAVFDQEGQLASAVARHLGIPIEIAPRANAVPFTAAENEQLQTPEPLHDPYLHQNRQLCRSVATFARVALTGYGGDDLLAGQAWPYFTHLLRQHHYATALACFGSYTLRAKRLPPLRAGFRSRLQRWLHRPGTTPGFPKWLAPKFAEKYNLQERWRHLQKPLTSTHPLHPSGYATLSADSWSSTFESEDAGWTRSPIELRAPFLDQRVLRFLLRIPPLPWCMDKYLLREITRGLLPESIRTRSKTPVADDLLEATVAAARWHPTPLPPPAPQITAFVDWHRLDNLLQRPSASASLWNDLRPLSLSYWLGHVEKASKIR